MSTLFALTKYKKLATYIHRKKILGKSLEHNTLPCIFIFIPIINIFDQNMYKEIRETYFSFLQRTHSAFNKGIFCPIFISGIVSARLSACRSVMEWYTFNTFTALVAEPASFTKIGFIYLWFKWRNLKNK